MDTRAKSLELAYLMNTSVINIGYSSIAGCYVFSSLTPKIVPDSELIFNLLYSSKTNDLINCEFFKKTSVGGLVIDCKYDKHGSWVKIHIPVNARYKSIITRILLWEGIYPYYIDEFDIDHVIKLPLEEAAEYTRQNNEYVG